MRGVATPPNYPLQPAEQACHGRGFCTGRANLAAQLSGEAVRCHETNEFSRTR
jgi:hypothetical protein